MQPEKTTPCPFCKRPLKLSGQPSGKLGCRQCRNSFHYDSVTGAITPLSPEEAKKVAGASKTLLFIRTHAILISLLASVLTLGLILWLFIPWTPAPPSGEPDAVIEDARRQLKSLTE